MSITLNLESPPGVPAVTRQFAPGSTIRIGGKVQTVFGIPVIGYTVIIDITRLGGQTFDALHLQDITNYLGDYWKDVQLPSANSSANIRVFVEYGIGSPDVANLPIGIGTAPAPAPPGPDEGGLMKAVRYAATGAVVLGGAYLVARFWPRK